MEREKNSTVCTVRVGIKGGNEWKPLHFTKETLMWEMKKAKRLTSSNCRGRDEKEELQFDEYTTSRKTQSPIN